MKPEYNIALSRYGGFDTLISPIANDVKQLSDEKRKLKFFKPSYASEREQLMVALSAIQTHLMTSSDVEQLLAMAEKQLENVEQLLQENVAKILETARPLEQTYRELDVYYKNANSTDFDNLTILHVNRSLLLDMDSEVVPNAVKTYLQAGEGIDLSGAYNLLVIPHLCEAEEPSRLIQKYAQLAGDANVCMMTDFADTDSTAETIELAKSKEWQGLMGLELDRSYLVMFANHPVLRKKHYDFPNDRAMRGSIAMAAAGKFYITRISQPIAGEKYGSLKHVIEPAFKVQQKEIQKLSELGLNAVIYAYEKTMIYEQTTHFDGLNYADKRYAVVNTTTYMKRVIHNYLGRLMHQALDNSDINAIRETINDFLTALKTEKIILSGGIIRCDKHTKQPDQLNLEIEFFPIWAIKNFVYDITASIKTHAVSIQEK